MAMVSGVLDRSSKKANLRAQLIQVFLVASNCNACMLAFKVASKQVADRREVYFSAIYIQYIVEQHPCCLKANIFF